MADTNRDINLRIRAKDYSKKTLQDLQKSISALTKSQEDQQKAASKGEETSRNLEKSYQDLEKATKAAIRQIADIKSFQNQSKALTDSQSATLAAQKAFEDYEKVLRNTPKVTSEQTKELAKLRKEMVNAEKDEQRQTTRLETISKRLESYGIATHDVQAAMAKLEGMVVSANKSLEAQESAIKDNEKAIKRLKKAEDDAAKAELDAAIDRQRKALEGAASDAISYAKGWRSAAVSTKAFGDAATPATSALNGVLGITSPLGKSIKTVDSEMRAMASEFNSSTGAISSTKDRMKELADAQRQLSKAASLVDTFRQQMTAVRDSRQEYSAAQKNVRDLAEQLKGAGDNSKSVQQQLSSAQQVLAKSAKSFRDNADAAHNTREQLNQLGVTTKSLVDAENQIVSTAGQVTNAQNAMTAAVGRGTAASIAEQSSAMAQASTEARSLAVGLNNVASSATPVSSAIDAIINPADKANDTLSKMETNADILANAFSSIRKPVEDTAKKMKLLADNQKAIKDTANLIDTFNRQKAAVGAARTAYVDAQRALKALDAEAKTGSISEADLAAQTAKASEAAATAAKTLREELNAAKQLRSELHGAGVDTNNLSDAASRLQGAATSAAKAENELSNAIDNFGKKSKSAHGDASGSAATLEGALRKVRNEVAMLTASYTGLQGAMQLGNNVIETAVKNQQFMSQISNAVGQDATKQAKEWEFVNKLSERWGLNLQQTSSDYARFAVSMVKSGRTVEEAHSLFENMAIIGTANNLNTDEFHRYVVAIDQMISQGQVMSEELKTQAGNVLPGAWELWATVLNKTTQGFAQKVKNGFYGIDAVLQANKSIAADALKAADNASKGISAARNRMENAKTAFYTQIGKSGFIDAYAQLLERLTKLLKSDESGRFANAIGKAFTTAANAAKFLLENIDTVIEVLKVLATVMITKKILGFAGTLKDIATAFTSVKGIASAASVALDGYSTSSKAATVATGYLARGFSLLGKAVPFIGWALIIGEFVSAIYSASDSFRDFCFGTMSVIKAAWDYITSLLTGNYKTWNQAMSDAKDWADQMRNDEDKKRLGIKTKEGFVADGHQKLSNDKGQFNDDDAKHQKAIDDARAKGKNQIADKMQADLDNNKKAREASKIGRVTDGGKDTFDDMDQRNKQFLTENEKLNKELDKQNKSADKKTYKEMWDERLRMVKEEYAPRLAEADALVASGKNANARIDAEKIMNKAIMVERKKFLNDVGKEEADRAAKRAEKIKEIEATIAQNRAEVTSRDESKNWTADNYGQREQNYIDSQIGKYKDLEAQIRKVGGAEAERLQTELNGVKESATEYARQAYQLQEIERYNNQIKSIESTRNAQLEELKAKREAYQISEVDYVDQVNAVYNNSKQALLDATEAAKKFGEANRDAFKTDAEYQQFVSKMDAFKTKTEASGNQLATYQSQAANGLAQSINTGFSSLVENITAVTQGTQSMSDAFQNTAVAMLQYFAQLLQQIAMTIIQAAIMDALLGGAPAASGAASAGSGSGGWASGAFGVFGAGKNHNGGMAGSSGIGVSRVPATMFSAAQRYHTGGMVGLQPDEVPIIAQQGEEVLTRKDPRNRLNGGTSDNNPNIRLIAVDDNRAAATEALKTPEGEKAMITVLRRNLSQVKNMVNN